MWCLLVGLSYKHAVGPLLAGFSRPQLATKVSQTCHFALFITAGDLEFIAQFLVDSTGPKNNARKNAKFDL